VRKNRASGNENSHFLFVRQEKDSMFEERPFDCNNYLQFSYIPWGTITIIYTLFPFHYHPWKFARRNPMKNIKAPAVAWVFPFLLLSTATASVTIDIRGKIVIPNMDSVSMDSVPGAYVLLKNYPDMRCSTDEHGSFRLTNNPNASVRQTYLGGTITRYRIAAQQGGFLVRSDGTQSSADIGLFNADGSRVGFGRISQGARECFINSSRSASGIQFIKISTEAFTKVYKVIPDMRIVTAGGMPNAATQYGGLEKKAIASYVDTLVAFIKGYTVGFFAVDKYQKSDVVGVIHLTNPWVNCMGPVIPKSRSMIKILAAGQDFKMGQFCDTIWGKKNGFPTSDLELPEHTTIFTNNFFMDSTEVTQKEYDSLMKATYTEYTKPAWTVTYGVGDNFPAYSVSWDDAVLFCNARSKRDHYDSVYTYSKITGTPGASSLLSDVGVQFSKSGYRLPTEAEWEYCCRAGKVTDFDWGKDIDYYKSEGVSCEPVNSKVVWAKNSLDLGSGSPGYGSHPVTEIPPNAYNLYGMAGNVSEWCNDWSGKYPWNSEIDPKGPTTGTSRVIRGGNWASGIFYLRGANRYFFVPSSVTESALKGFRTVRMAGAGE
jgi:formylglycine-generating enzyme